MTPYATRVGYSVLRDACRRGLNVGAWWDFRLLSWAFCARVSVGIDPVTTWHFAHPAADTPDRSARFSGTFKIII